MGPLVPVHAQRPWTAGCRQQQWRAAAQLPAAAMPRSVSGLSRAARQSTPCCARRRRLMRSGRSAMSPSAGCVTSAGASATTSGAYQCRCKAQDQLQGLALPVQGSCVAGCQQGFEGSSGMSTSHVQLKYYREGLSARFCTCWVLAKRQYRHSCSYKAALQGLSSEKALLLSCLQAARWLLAARRPASRRVRSAMTITLAAWPAMAPATPRRAAPRHKQQLLMRVPLQQPGSVAAQSVGG